MARPTMTPYPPHQPYPYAPAQPYAAPVVPPYAMPQPGYAAPYGGYGAPPAFDPVEARLRHYAQMGADTAVGAVPGQDQRLLSVIDAAVGAMQNTVKSSEQKTVAALDALTTLIEKQRASDLTPHIQRPTVPGHPAGIEVERSPVAQVNQVLASLVERLNSLEQSVTAAGKGRGTDAMAEARQLEDRVGEALEALSRDLARPAGVVDALQRDDMPGRGPRAALRPRIAVPRGGTTAVAEIEARRRLLDATPRATGPETAALEAIRRSVAALADQVRETRRMQQERPETDIRGELQQLQESIAELAPRQSVSALNDTIRALSQKVEQSRQDGVRESNLAPIEKLLTDMRVTLDELRQPRGMESVNSVLTQMSRRLDAIGERSLDQRHLDGIQRQIAEIRTVVADAQPAASLDGLNRQIKALATKLDDLAERPRDTRVMAMLADAVEDVRGNMKRIDPELFAERIERRLAGLDSLEARIDKISEHIARPVEPTRVAGLESLEARIEQLADRLAKQPSPAKPAALAGLEARLDRLTDQLAAAAPVPASGFSGLEGIEARLDKLNERLAQETPAPLPALDGLSQRIEAMTKTLSRRPSEPDLSPIVKRIDEVRAELSRQKSGDVSALESRIAALQKSLEQRPGEPDIKSLEQILRKLAERIEDVRAPGAAPAALDDLQVQMAKLAARLEQPSPGAPALGGLERTLSDLCQKVGSLQDTAAMAAGEAVRQSIGQLQAAPSMDTLAAEGMVLIKRDLTEMKSAQADADARSREVLQHVNSTLEKIVGRLASLEGDIVTARAAPPKVSVAVPPPLISHPPATAPTAAAANVGRAAPMLAKTVDALAERPPRAETTTTAAPRAQAVAHPAPADLDADLPLEPGAGRSGRPDPQDMTATPASDDPRANFIAAARRAAQAAAAQTSAAIAEADQKGAKGAGVAGKLDGFKQVLAARRKPILLGVAALLVLVSGLKVFNTFLAGGKPEAPRVSTIMPEPPAAAQPMPQEAAPPAKLSMSPVLEAIPNDPVTVGSVGTPPIQTAPGVQPAPSMPAAADPAPPKAEPVGDLATLIKTTTFTAPDRLKQLAGSGNLSAIYEVGARMAEGRGTLRDAKAAAQWMEYAANQGFAPAQYRMGSFNREGIGNTKDSKKAFAWFQKSAQQGNILAMHNLAVLYAEGVNGAPDYAAAAQWFRNAAEHGVKDSQFNIAILNVRGLGIAQDLGEAYKWFAAAARQGDADAGKKRDEIGARMTPDKLAEAKKLADGFQAKRPEPRANELTVPDGGWDGPAKFPLASSAPAKKVKT